VGELRSKVAAIDQFPALQACTQSADAAVRFDGSAPTSDWVTRMSTPNRYGVLSSDDDRAEYDEPFVPVVSRRAKPPKRQRQHSSPATAASPATNTRVRSSPPAASDVKSWSWSWS